MALDYDNLEKVFHHVFFNELRISPEDHPVLVVEHLLNPKAQRERIADTLFKKFDVVSLMYRDPFSLAALAMHKVHGLAVTLGDGVTASACVHQGYCIPSSLALSDITGHELTEFVLLTIPQLPSSSGNWAAHWTTSAEKMLACKIKEEVGFVSLDFENDKDDSSMDFPFELPDGNHLLIPSLLRCAIGEALFDPSALSGPLETIGIHTMIMQSLERVGNDARKVINSIILTGGVSQIPGLQARLDMELAPLVAKKYPTLKLAILDPKPHASWFGGSVLTLAQAKEECISKEAWSEKADKAALLKSNAKMEKIFAIPKGMSEKPLPTHQIFPCDNCSVACRLSGDCSLCETVYMDYIFPLSTNAAEGEEEEDPVTLVIEVTSSQISLGLAGEEAPLVTRSLLKASAGANGGGASVMEFNSALNWMALEKELNAALQEFLLRQKVVKTFENVSALVLTSMFGPPSYVSRLILYLLGQGFKSVNAIEQPLAALYGLGKTTGMVIVCGYDLVQILPVYDGFSFPGIATRIHIRGVVSPITLLDAIATSVVKCLARLPIDLRKELLLNVVLCARSPGASAANGEVEVDSKILEYELLGRWTISDPKVQITVADTMASWAGASVLGGLASFRQKHVTAEQYRKNFGKALAMRECQRHDPRLADRIDTVNLTGIPNGAKPPIRASISEGINAKSSETSKTKETPSRRRSSLLSLLLSKKTPSADTKG